MTSQRLHDSAHRALVVSADAFAIWCVPLVPTFGAVHQRIVLPESKRYNQVRENRELDDLMGFRMR